MEIIVSQDGSSLKVVKSLQEEIDSCSDKELKAKLESFQREFISIKAQEKAYQELLSPTLTRLGDKLKEFNKPQSPPPVPTSKDSKP